MTTATSALLALALVFGGLLPVAAAEASRYRVDVLVFLDNAPVGNEQPVPALLPLPSGAIAPADISALSAAGITMLPDTSFGLDKQWQALRYSRDFHPLLKLSWIQGSRSSGTQIAIDEGTPIPLAGLQVTPVEGHIALYTGTLLHLDAHLTYNLVAADGAVASYGLDEVRRVKFNELHYLDSPRLGVLARVTKVR